MPVLSSVRVCGPWLRAGAFQGCQAESVRTAPWVPPAGLRTSPRDSVLRSPLIFCVPGAAS